MSTTPTPGPAPMTGRKEERDGDTLLVIERRFRASTDDVWAACTDPERMKRWIGTWSGDPASGSVSFRMTAEGEDVEAEDMDVLACDSPRRFAVRGQEPQPFSIDGSGDKAHWEMELELAAAGWSRSSKARTWTRSSGRPTRAGRATTGSTSPEGRRVRSS